MTTFIEPPELSLVDSDMSSNTSLIFTVLLTACMGGMYIYDMYKKQKETESSIKELENNVETVEAIIETHSNLIEEQEQRLLEKKNYDDSEEIEEKTYQAWEGTFESSSLYNERMIYLKITLCREKLSTIKKNKEWVAWNHTDDGSVTVRDFYLGNNNPEFKWEFVSRDCYGDSFLEIITTDSFINGWDSVIRININAKVYIPTILDEDDEYEDERDVLVQFIEEESSDDDNKLMNKVLKKCIEDKCIDWSRILIEA